MATNTERDALPTWSAHTLVMTLLEGDEPFNGHCTCDRWSYSTNDWADLGARWAWHYVADSGGPPDGYPTARAIVRRELERHGEYGGDCARCGYPVIRGRTHCRSCEPRAVARDECGDNCERNCCWEATVAKRHARDAAHQRVACSNCGNCLDCDDERSPDHEDCICPLGQAIPVGVAA